MGPERRYPIILSLLKQTLIDLTDERIDIFDVCIASRHKKAKEALEDSQKEMADRRDWLGPHRATLSFATPHRFIPALRPFFLCEAGGNAGVDVILYARRD
jgi:hypothetical protein